MEDVLGDFQRVEIAGRGLGLILNHMKLEVGWAGKSPFRLLVQSLLTLSQLRGKRQSFWELLFRPLEWIAHSRRSYLTSDVYYPDYVTFLHMTVSF